MLYPGCYEHIHRTRAKQAHMLTFLCKETRPQHHTVTSDNEIHMKTPDEFYQHYCVTQWLQLFFFVIYANADNE